MAAPYAYNRYMYIIVFIAFIFSLIPLYNIYRNAICVRSKPKPKLNRRNAQSNTNSESVSSSSPPVSPRNNNDKRGIHLPLKVKISLMLSLTLAFIYMLVNCIQAIFMFIDLDPTYFPDTVYCKFLMSIQLTSYIGSRGLLYFFFILRSYETFKGSGNTYNKSSIYGMLVFAFTVIAYIVIPTVWQQWAFVTYYIGPDMSGHGTFCYNDYAQSKYRFPIPLYPLLFTGSLCDIFYAYLSVHLLASKLFRLIHIQNISIADNKNKDIECVQMFHEETRNSNKMILIVSRLLILLFVAIVSSQLAIVLLLIAVRYTPVIYSIDSCINMYCLWLNFSFATYYYDKYFLGKQCINGCFPIVKTLALTCIDCSAGNKNGCQQCAVCCCYCCKHCCDSDERRKQKKIYSISKGEIELMSL